MKDLVIATQKHIDDIVALRVEMQIEDWCTTLNEDFSCYAEAFANITREHMHGNSSLSRSRSRIFPLQKPALISLKPEASLKEINGRIHKFPSKSTKADIYSGINSMNPNRGLQRVIISRRHLGAVF